ncbi:Universal stress A family [Hyphodiscus hymeniophilus]|uniref:Universal stress A family n=1 Tax=Hyphodiscus hymeniophilus TaxID=353542 RepID=A0A9P6VJ24_9HELO|nr:Universal stress A family [Hyphodiscus hymeniophilus]
MSISPLSQNSPHSPHSPVSPKGNPTAEGYFNPPRAENPRLESITEHVRADHARRPRTSSAASIQFMPSLATSQGSVVDIVRSRLPSCIRDVSPPPARFQHHVSFDNFAEGEPTKRNTISLTLNVSHRGYQRKRRSRTFMVGVDGNDYSDIALQWMLDELVDDGDHIVCLRVVDRDTKIAKDAKLANDKIAEKDKKSVEKEKKEYVKEAHDLMKHIQRKNDANRAVSITLEFAVGKVSDTFGSMIAMYEPSMLVVGTRGRSLGGFQGLVSNRNSFSKWCLQHSPVPVVVVRPTKKRIKKKAKRDADPQRQDYARILRDSGVEIHEIVGGTKTSNFEIANDRDTEAHAVAAALGLPAQFDPTLKPLRSASDRTLNQVDSAKSDATIPVASLSPGSRSVSPTEVSQTLKPPQLESPAISGDEAEESEDDDEEEGEFEVVSGNTLLGNSPWDEKKEELHRMEQSEAGALLLGRKDSISSAGSSGSAGGGALIYGKDGDGEYREKNGKGENNKDKVGKKEETDEPEVITPTAPMPN